MLEKTSSQKIYYHSTKQTLTLNHILLHFNENERLTQVIKDTANSLSSKMVKSKAFQNRQEYSSA
jgi:hypothetical protein